MTAGYVGTRRRPSTALRLLGSERVEAVASAVFGATLASAMFLRAGREHAAALTALIISGAALALVIASALAGYSYARSMRYLGGDR